MEYSDVLKKVQEVMVSVSGIDDNDVKEGASLMDDLSLSSLEIITVISRLEREFRTRIAEADMRTFITVGDLVKFIVENSEEKPR